MARLNEQSLANANWIKHVRKSARDQSPTTRGTTMRTVEAILASGTSAGARMGWEHRLHFSPTGEQIHPADARTYADSFSVHVQHPEEAATAEVGLKPGVGYGISHSRGWLVKPRKGMTRESAAAAVKVLKGLPGVQASTPILTVEAILASGTSAGAKKGWEKKNAEHGLYEDQFAFRDLAHKGANGLKRYVATLHYPEGAEEVDVDAPHEEGARDIAKRAAKAHYQPGFKKISLRGPMSGMYASHITPTPDTILAGAPMGNRNAAGHRSTRAGEVAHLAFRRGQTIKALGDLYDEEMQERADSDGLRRSHGGEDAPDDVVAEHYKDEVSEYAHTLEGNDEERHEAHSAAALVAAEAGDHPLAQAHREAAEKCCASSRSSTDIIHCACAVSELVTAGQPWVQDQETSFMYMPAGRHTIIAGFRGKAIELTVEIDPEMAAKVLTASMEQLQASQPKQRLFGCIEHAEKDASVWAKKFEARPDGVYLCAEPSGLGARHVNEKIHRSWSPSFLTDADYAKARLVSDIYQFPDGVKGSKSNPAKITGCAFCLGTLTNKPAFREMSPVMAREAVDAVVMAMETTDQRSEAAKRGWLGRAAADHHASRAKDVAKEGRGQTGVHKDAFHQSELAHIASKLAYEQGGLSAHKQAAASHDLAARMHENRGDSRSENHRSYQRAHQEIVDSKEKAIQQIAGHPDITPEHKKVAIDAVVSASSATPTSLNPQPFLDFLSQLRLAHWAANTSTEEHETLGELYEALESLVDEFVEQSLGAEGTTVVPSTPSLPELLESGCTLVQAELDRAPSEGVKNTLAEMCGALDKARYLLKAKDQEMNGNTVTAGGTSEGARKGWEHRDAHAKLAKQHLESFDAAYLSKDGAAINQHILSAKAHFLSELANDGESHRQAGLAHEEAAQSYPKTDAHGERHRAWAAEHFRMNYNPTSASTPPTAADVLRATGTSEGAKKGWEKKLSNEANDFSRMLYSGGSAEQHKQAADLHGRAIASLPKSGAEDLLAKHTSMKLYHSRMAVRLKASESSAPPTATDILRASNPISPHSGANGQPAV